MNKSRYQKFKKPILFVDFMGIISQDKFWKLLADPTNKLHKYYDSIHKFLFTDNKNIVHDWMKGLLTSEEIHTILNKEIGLPYEEGLYFFIKGLIDTLISYPILEVLQQLKKFYYIVMVTDNIDGFDRFVLPANSTLVETFDQIDNSYNTGLLKLSNNGVYFSSIFGNISSEYKKKSVLVDDSLVNCEMFQSIGGIAYNILGGELEVIAILSELYTVASAEDLSA